MMKISRINGEVVNNKIEPKKRKRITRDEIVLIVMASLGIIFLAVFAYAPLYGLVLAFKNDYEYINILDAIKKGSWAGPYGLNQFKTFIQDPEFKDGKKVEIVGKIDRLDIGKLDDKTYVRIVDYKSKIRDLDMNKVETGLQIQLITYLDAICKTDDVEPAGILYSGLIDGKLKLRTIGKRGLNSWLIAITNRFSLR